MSETKFIARVTLEAGTAISVCGSQNDTISYSTVARDANGLPFIPASSLKGAINKEMKLINDKSRCFFFTDAIMTDENGIAVDGLREYDIFHKKSARTELHPFFRYFETLPVRYHAGATLKGATQIDNKGINSEQVVYKGTRFVFEIEMTSFSYTDQDRFFFNGLLSRLKYHPLYIGRGSRRGLGLVRMVDCLKAEIDMTNISQLNAYINKTGKLDDDWSEFKRYIPSESDSDIFNRVWKTYTINLKPVDFFIFGAMYENKEYNHPSLTERYFIWVKTRKGVEASVREGYLIPASAIKGALRHRTKYYYCRKKRIFSHVIEDGSVKTINTIDYGQIDKDISELFGYRGGTRGNLIIPDIYIPKSIVEHKTMHHTAIDRLTGEKWERAVHNEEVLYMKAGMTINLIMMVNESEIGPILKNAFWQSVKDLEEGRLSLGRDGKNGMGFFEKN